MMRRCFGAPRGRMARSASAMLLAPFALTLAACHGGDGTKGGSDSAGAAAAPAASTGAGNTTGATTGATAGSTTATASGDNAGLTLPAGFRATVFADSLGPARHLVVAPNGDVYVNTWVQQRGEGATGTRPKSNGFLVLLRDSAHTGHATVTRFGASGPAGGGTGIALYHGALFAESNPKTTATIVKYTLGANGLPTGAPVVVVSGLPTTGDHPMHPFVIDSTSGALYVDLGSATNSCQVKNRTLESPGHAPCTELETRGGVWRFDANRTNQTFSAANRYATGIRNGEGLTFGPGGQLWDTQHGRDQLHDNWPKLYTEEQGENLPAEEIFPVAQGADYGWPECYFDNQQGKLVLAPEYGGDGGKTAGVCAQKHAPAAYFPAHWAPDDMKFYMGSQFPAHYRGGAFIAFHGSWNRAPGPQGGYNVVFVPFNGATPASANQYEVFANGFAGGQLRPDRAAHRPAGLAVGPDGTLYVADDKGGRIYRITYGGPR